MQDLKLMLGSVRPDKLAKQGWARKWGWDGSARDIDFAENSFGGLKSQYSTAKYVVSGCQAVAFCVVDAVFQEMHK